MCYEAVFGKVLTLVSINRKQNAKILFLRKVMAV